MSGSEKPNLWYYSYNNTNRLYSPITMNKEWNSLARLTSVGFYASLGTLTNIFFISSFFVEKTLRKTGNVYLACVGLADLIITAGVVPTSALVLVSGKWDIPEVCYGLQFFTQASIYAYNLLFMMVAIENYVRICERRACYSKFLRINPGLMTALIFAIGFLISGAGVYFGIEYDYCNRYNYGDYAFRIASSMATLGGPFATSVIMLSIAAHVVHERAHRLVNYKRSLRYNQDYQFTYLNLCGYLTFVAFWIPYLVVVYQYPATADENYYICVLIGLSRSIVTSVLYNALNKNFRQAYSHLFNYCCCKVSLNSPFRNRRRHVMNTALGVNRMHGRRGDVAGPSEESEAPEI